MDYREIGARMQALRKARGMTQEQLAERTGITPAYLYDKYNRIYRQFDDWALIKSDKDNVSITDIVMKLKADRHIETIDW